jgi:hypothetical protein
MRASGSRWVAAGLTAMLALAACGGDSSSGNTNLTQDQAAAVGSAAVGAVGDLVSGLTHFATPDVGGLGSGFFAPMAPGGRVLTASVSRLDPRIARGLAHISAGDCTPAQTNTTDTDGDGIQDDNTITFTIANCSFTDTTDQGDPVTFSLTGKVRVQDTDGAAVFFGYRVAFTALTITAQDTAGASVAAGLSGTVDVSVQGTLASSSEDLRSSLRLDGAKLYGDHAKWTATYTPSTGTITPGTTSLPAGQFAINGNYGWNGQLGDWSFTLLTPAPLTYDGACDSPEWPFGSGQLQGAITLRQTVGFTVDYTGCDTPGTIMVYGNTP